MPVIQETVLERMPTDTDVEGSRRLIVRVYDHTNQCGGGWYELRGEDPGGGLRFAYRDPRKFVVIEEYESTITDLLDEYRVVDPFQGRQ